MEPLLLGESLHDIFRDALRWLLLPTQQGEDLAAKIIALRNEPFFLRLSALLQPVQEASNQRNLRQILTRIGLSPALASFEAESGASLELTPDLFDDVPPAPPYAAARLGADATALFIEALRLHQPVMQALLKEGSFKQHQETSQRLGPQELSRLRHKLILGDLLPPSAAEVFLANLRGQVALLALFSAALDTKQTPEWKAVALGEIAVEGMKAFQRLVLPGPNHLDARAAMKEHEQRKDMLFAQLEAEAAGTVKADAP